MASNPHLSALWRRRAHRRRVEGIPWRIGRGILGLGGAILLSALLRPVLLGWLDGPRQVWATGATGVVLRMGLVLVAIAALDLYSALIRSEERRVLGLHPVDPGEVAVAALVRCTLDRIGALFAMIAVLVPIGLAGDWPLFAACVAALASTYLFGQVVAAWVHLTSVEVAESPRYAPLLDMIRGANPRPQAAFIYAPGATLLLAALLVSQAAGAVGPASELGLLAALWIALPAALAIPLGLSVPSVARRTWFQASAVLADIDARHGVLDARDDVTAHVYLEWAVRFLPSSVALYALKDLRHGWRARRTWLTGAWVTGFAAALSGWTDDPAGPSVATALVLGSIALCAGVGVVMERDEPDFLRAWLPSGGADRAAGRVFVVILWMQGCVWPAVFTVALRAGFEHAAMVCVVGELAAVVSAVLALACGVLRGRGLVLYGPVAAVLAAVGAWGVA